MQTRVDEFETLFTLLWLLQGVHTFPPTSFLSFFLFLSGSSLHMMLSWVVFGVSVPTWNRGF